MTGHFIRRAVALAAAVVSLSASPSARLQSPSDYQALKKEIDALKAQQQALQQQIDDLKAQNKAPASAAPAGPIQPVNLVFQLDKVAMRGSEAARVVLIEVGDFECPFCGRHFRQTAPQVEKEFVDSGKIRHAFLNFPLDKHLNAFKASEAASCAADQGKYWPMFDRLFSNQTTLGLRQLPGHALALGLNADTFKACLDSGKHGADLKSEMVQAQRAGVTATPTFFLGVFDPKTHSAKVSSRIVGAKPLAVFEEAIRSSLAALGGGAARND